MCGRNSVFLTADALADRFDAAVVAEGYRPRYNIAPTQPHPVITNEAPERIEQFRWGLLPHWMDEPGAGYINARSETVDQLPAFRSAWERHPCLVPSTGFYEWQTPERGDKQPYRIFCENVDAFAFAGLWDRWEGNGRTVSSVTILTTEATGVVTSIHDRMPVILREEDESTWLQAPPAERRTLCQPYPGDDLCSYPISPQVNDPSNDEKAIIEPWESDQADFDDFV